MPVEIRELLIKGEVDASSTVKGESKSLPNVEQKMITPEQKEQLIEEIVAEVLRRIAQAQER